MGETVQFVGFKLGAQQFAIEIHRVIEVISLCPIASLPGTASFLEGMIDLRGQLIPVVDLRKRVGLNPIVNSMQTRILIARIHRKRTGLIVDEADQVYTVPVENIQLPPQPGSSYVLAVANHENQMLVILDLETLLSGEEFIHLEKLALSAGAQVPGSR